MEAVVKINGVVIGRVKDFSFVSIKPPVVPPSQETIKLVDKVLNKNYDKEI